MQVKLFNIGVAATEAPVGSPMMDLVGVPKLADEAEAKTAALCDNT